MDRNVRNAKALDLDAVAIVHGEPVSIPANSSMGSEMLAPDQRNYKPVDRF